MPWYPQTEIVHWLGGLLLGAGAYSFIQSSRHEKTSWTGFVLAGALGFILAEILLH